jgi:hypothetical protein
MARAASHDACGDTTSALPDVVAHVASRMSRRKAPILLRRSAAAVVSCWLVGMFAWKRFVPEVTLYGIWGTVRVGRSLLRRPCLVAASIQFSLLREIGSVNWNLLKTRQMYPFCSVRSQRWRQHNVSGVDIANKLFNIFRWGHDASHSSLTRLSS